MILLSVDPGLIHPAAAVFENSILKKASRVKVPKGITTKTPMIERCRAISLAVLDYANCPTPDVICVEYPQIYTQDKSKGDPNNLIPLAVIGGVLAGLCPKTNIIAPRPRDWTGTIPKREDGDPWASPRGQRVWDRLSDAERAVVVPSHDAVDSVGIGLWYLGRFKRIRVYDTGTET